MSKITHYNNAITSGTAARYTGKMTIRMTGFDTAPDLNYDWTMWETPNSANPCAFPTGPNTGGCADQITFVSELSGATLTKNGISYRLVIGGFGAASGTNCPATPGTTTLNSDFLTAESATTTSCIYASLSQVRTLNIVKQVTAPAGTTVPGFSYSSSSTLSGSPWTAPSFTLTPPSTTGTDSVTRELVQGESVTVTEGTPTDSRWALTGLTCVDGDGGSVAGVTTSVASGTVKLTNVPAPPTISAGPITCTYTNTYTPKATLSLTKNVTGGSATAADFTRSASGPTVVSGPGGSAAVTNQSVLTGTYTLSESAGVSGYVAGSWSCTGAASSTATTVTITDGQTVSCGITNRFATGTLRITKTITDPDNGFTGTASTSFSGNYRCGNGASTPFTVSTGTPFTVSGIPTGTICTVVETQPSGSLANSSFSWGAPTYSTTNGQVTTGQVTIPDSAAGTVAITNTISRSTGAVSVTKVVTPRDGTPSVGWTGGANRQFPVSYTCTAGSEVVTGTVNAKTSGAVSISGLPATATCTFTENQTAAPGDFLNSSYAWDGYAFAPTTVTVPANGSVSTQVTNYFRRVTAQLTISKSVNGGGYVGGTGKNFTVRRDCGIDSGVVTLADGGAQTVTVQASTACTVKEDAPADNLLDAGHNWGAASYNGSISVPESTTGSVAKPPAKRPKRLPHTGNEVPAWLPWAGGAVVLVGGALLIAGRRRRG